MSDKVVVSVMRGNAGAGGAMAAISSDLVWAHENIIINPHYKVGLKRLGLFFFMNLFVGLTLFIAYGVHSKRFYVVVRPPPDRTHGTMEMTRTDDNNSAYGH